jgi:hypothetical protein
MTVGIHEVVINISENVLSNHSLLKIEALHSAEKFILTDQYIVP